MTPTWLAAATQEVQDTGSISRETVIALLELSGQTMNEEQMNRTREALEMLIRDFEPIRQFRMPAGVEPATCFRAR